MGAKLSILLLLLASVLLGLLRSDRFSVVGGKPGRMELTFWNGFTGPDGRIMLGIIRQFNEADPDAHVTMQRMDWGTYYNKLMVAGIDGRGPDIFVIHAATLARMQRAEFVDRVDDLFDGPGGLPRDDFDPYVLEQVDYGGMLGVPLDVHPQGLYCNGRMFRDAGLVNPDGSPRPPTNREEFLSAMRLLLRDDPATRDVEQWGFSYTMWRNNYMSLAPQFGGTWFDENGKCTLDHPGNVAALEFLASLYREHRLVPEPENNLGWVGFRQQKVAMVFDGIYMLGDLKRLGDIEYVAAPIPLVGTQPGTLADAHVLCIRSDLSPERRAAAARFVRFLSDHSLEWAEAGQVPARRSMRDTDRFRAMPVQSAIARQVPHVRFPPKTPVLFEFHLEVDLAVEQVIRHGRDAREVLRRASDTVDRIVERDRQQQLHRGATP
jgi:multiple sugar transport system substrate-binding protein